MQRFAWRLLAASSLLITTAAGMTRAEYGGALRVQVREMLLSLDPANTAQPDSIARRNLLRLLFDPVLAIDPVGGLEPRLATAWQAEPGNQRWHLWLRPAIKFDDGSPLTADLMAASLSTANPSWKVRSENDSIIIELSVPNPALAQELALPKNFIVKRTAGGLEGTGPFLVTDWQPGKSLSLLAREDYWGGRPFLNSIEVELGKNMHAQAMALELGKADVVQIAPEEARRILRSQRLVQSAPIELMALVFRGDASSAEERKWRASLSAGIDRTAMKDVLLGGEGEAATAVLPEWISGYEFVFSASLSSGRAPQERHGAAEAPLWTVAVEPTDPWAGLIAERVVLNARDLGIKLQLTNSERSDLRLVRIPLLSLDPRMVLAQVIRTLGLAAPAVTDNSLDALFQAESVLLQTQRIIPLLHLTVNYGLSRNVKNWEFRRDGSWVLANVWVSLEKP